jgi:diadenosine tetraphosphate (Ap4A) HIT family hydrolase
MPCDICAWTPEPPNFTFVYETALWRVVLPLNQCLLGLCVVSLKRHCGDLAELRPDELLDWLKVVNKLEPALRTAFGATMFNWSCYMNHAYRNSSPDPHIHWWAVPRYNHPVTLGSLTFEDPDFGNPYSHARWLEVPADLRQTIVARIQAFI